MTAARQRRVLGGGVAFLATFAVCVIGGAMWRTDPSFTDTANFGLPPGTKGHPLGTDGLGRDVLARVLRGGTTSLLIATGVTVLSTGIGVALGALAALGPGAVRRTVDALADAMLTLPFLVVVLAVQSVLPRSALTVVGLLSAFTWVFIARITRAQLLSLRSQEFVRAAIASGAAPGDVARRHLLPNAAPTIAAMAAVVVGEAILAETALGYLGLGVPPDRPTWGNILNGAQRDLLAGYWWVLAWPAVGIACCVVSIGIVARAFDTSARGVPLGRTRDRGRP